MTRLDYTHLANVEHKIDDAINICKRIINEVKELPEVAEEFGESILEKTLDIQIWIDENNHVTNAQFSALENMLQGCYKWNK